MKTATTHQAKTHLSRLLKEVQTGETIVILSGNVPVAQLTAIVQSQISRSASVSMPDSIPRDSVIGRTGISSIRFPKAKASTFWPGDSCSRSRTALRITIWYLGEMVTEVIPAPPSILCFIPNSIDPIIVRQTWTDAQREFITRADCAGLLITCQPSLVPGHHLALSRPDHPPNGHR